MKVDQRYLVVGCLLMFLSLIFWQGVHSWDAENARAYNNYEISTYEYEETSRGIESLYILIVVMFLVGAGCIIFCLFPKKEEELQEIKADKRNIEEKQENDTIKILNNRYAKGEITKEEYEQIKKDIES